MKKFSATYRKLALNKFKNNIGNIVHEHTTLNPLKFHEGYTKLN